LGKHPTPPYPWRTSTTATESKITGSKTDENYGCSSFAVIGVPLKDALNIFIHL
jgi:hypothetical protein